MKNKREQQQDSGLRRRYDAPAAETEFGIASQDEFDEFMKGESLPSKMSRSGEERSYFHIARITEPSSKKYQNNDQEFADVRRLLEIGDEVDDILVAEGKSIALEGLSQYLERVEAPHSVVIYDGSELARTVQDYISRSNPLAGQDNR